jgi:hypothetical protein
MTSPMTVRVWVRAAVVLLVISASLSARSTLAEPCIASLPDSLGAARGYLFIATLTAVDPGQSISSWTFHVTKVYAGAQPPGPHRPEVVRVNSTLTFRESCADVRGLDPGATYLLSKFDLHSFSAPTTVVWTVSGQAVHLVVSYPDAPYDPRLNNPSTIVEAVALMSSDLPPTDLRRDPRPDMTGLLALLFALGGAAGAVCLTRRRATKPA